MVLAVRSGPQAPRRGAHEIARRATVDRAAERVALVVVDVLALLLGGACFLGTDAVGWAATAACIAGCIPSLACLGLYRPRLHLSSLDDVPRLAGGAIVGAALALALLWAIDSPAERAASLGWALVSTVGSAVFGRAVGYPIVRWLRARRVRRPTLIVGTGQVAARLADQLNADRTYGLLPIGQLTGSASLGDTRLPILGTAAQLPELLKSTRAECVLVAFSDDREADLVDVLRGIGRDAVDVLCVPRLYEMHPRAEATDQIGPIPLIRLSHGEQGPAARAAKRLFNAAFALVSLIVLAPILAGCAVAVRIESGPGVIFRQQRIGRDGIPFTLFKFRTLRPADQHESATLWSVIGDPRIGPVGRMLRRTSLDELPQLVNILRGNMALVGPRPERPHFAAEFAHRYSGYRHRHRTDVGLTGWAQVNGLRGPTSIAERALLDNWYIENWSLWLDLTIVLRTIGEVVGGVRGAQR